MGSSSGSAWRHDSGVSPRILGNICRAATRSQWAGDVGWWRGSPNWSMRLREAYMLTEYQRLSETIQIEDPEGLRLNMDAKHLRWSGRPTAVGFWNATNSCVMLCLRLALLTVFCWYLDLLVSGCALQSTTPLWWCVCLTCLVVSLPNCRDGFVAKFSAWKWQGMPGIPLSVWEHVIQWSSSWYVLLLNRLTLLG